MVKTTVKQPPRTVLSIGETPNKSFDWALQDQAEGLKTNGNCLIPFPVNLSNHEWNELIQSSLWFMFIDGRSYFT